MRGTPWLVGLVCVMLVVVPTSLFAGAQEPERPSAPSREAPDTTRLQEWTGQSVLHFKGACVAQLARCVADLEREDGTFFLPAPAGGGTIVVSWRPVNESLRVLKVQVAGVEVTGESPVRLDFPGFEAGEHAVRIEPARPLVGAYSQSADWVATFAVTPSPETVERQGTSTFHGIGACVLGTCDPKSRTDSDTFVAPWSARGTLVADWDALAWDEARIAIRGTGLAVEGAPPLTLDVHGLAPGEYAVDVTPLPIAHTLQELPVSWRATLTPG